MGAVSLGGDQGSWEEGFDLMPGLVSRVEGDVVGKVWVSVWEVFLCT